MTDDRTGNPGRVPTPSRDGRKLAKPATPNAIHTVRLRCSSVTYVKYAPSSRLPDGRLVRQLMADPLADGTSRGKHDAHGIGDACG